MVEQLISSGQAVRLMPRQPERAHPGKSRVLEVTESGMEGHSNEGANDAICPSNGKF